MDVVQQRALETALHVHVIGVQIGCAKKKIGNYYYCYSSTLFSRNFVGLHELIISSIFAVLNYNIRFKEMHRQSFLLAYAYAMTMSDVSQIVMMDSEKPVLGLFSYRPKALSV